MSRQLDILALEPFFGGTRRNMLETIVRCSRHRWTILKLPPRRMERRLAVAAHWFAEQLSRHSIGSLDLLFTSEALNLADLFRLVPEIASTPSVVYFHNNQLPEPGVKSANLAMDFSNLNTAAAASEIWFNSRFHVRDFLASLSALVAANDEFAAQNPIPTITGKLRFMPPPVDSSAGRQMARDENLVRKDRKVFFETRDANIDLFNAAMAILSRRGDKIELYTVGPIGKLTNDVPRETILENDQVGQMRAILQSSAFVSTRIAATFDENAIHSLRLGCRSVFPRTGVYPELLPKNMHGFCLYDVSADSLASRLQDAIYLPEPPTSPELEPILKQFDNIAVCKAMDDRLEEVAKLHAPKPKAPPIRTAI